MSISNCPICGRETCEIAEHENPVILTLHPALVGRMETSQFVRMDWRGYNIAPLHFGKLPILLKLTMLHTRVPIWERVWWVAEHATHRGGRMHQHHVHLVEIPPPSFSTQTLKLFEAETPITPASRGFTARGRSEEGYFLLTTADSFSAVTHSTLWNVECSLELDNQLQWEASRVAGTLRVLRGSFTVYDHRFHPGEVARVEVGQGWMEDNPTREWQFVHLYPPSAPPVGRFCLNRAGSRPLLDWQTETIEWSGTGDHSWAFLILPLQGDEDVWQTTRYGVTAAMAHPANPSMLLDALEAHLVVDLDAPLSQADQDNLNATWEKYKKIRARAEGTNFANEAVVSFTKAIRLISSLLNYDDDYFTEYICSMENAMLQNQED